MRIVVIGSGFGGLSAAIRLQAQGHQVTIVEKLDKPGGRAYVFEQDGFTFDGGPTIITVPWMLDELFATSGRQTADYVDLVKLNPFYNICFEDGSVFHYNDNEDELVRQVRAFSPGDVDGYHRFRQRSGEILKAGMALIDKSFHDPWPMLSVVPTLAKLRADRSVAGMASAHLRDPRLQQVFSFHPLLVGGNPYRASAMYALIHALEQEWGVWFARGGTGALVRGLVRCFEDLGGELRLNAEVSSIALSADQKRTTGVRLANGETLAADAVVCNGDLAQAYRTLLPESARPAMSNRKIARYRHSMSLFVIYFGTNKQYPERAHHEILLGPRYKALLEDIFERKILADDFSLYLHRPTATEPSLAPPGHDCWYVLSPVPHLGGNIDWETAGQRYRDRIFEYLESRYLPNLRQHLVTERRIDPRYFERTLNSYLGSAFGPEPTLLQSGYFRPHSRSSDIPNLYFCGAGPHPGAGIPGVIASGKIVADLIGAASGAHARVSAERMAAR
ncbi:MAG: phytoene desaturase [Gemmatimonadaceae bacterium]|nr:phytoene desaturase [Gemmatimonadaceae bacterium]